MDVLLYNSTVCRLCGEENENGTLLYSPDENSQNLSELINTYLPLKVIDDGQLPRTVCPGCTIQVEATVEFLNLVIKGQKIIRELHQREIDYKKKTKNSEECNESVILEYRLNENGEVYQVEHQIALQVAGLDKPKRKRGRPPKKQKTPEELALEAAEQEKLMQKVVLVEEPDPSGKRRRKAPDRFREAVQGKELEKILKEEGVIDPEESESESKEDSPPAAPEEPKEPEVIGLMESQGELVEIVVVKGKKRGRPRGRNAQHESCGICGMTFSGIGRYMSHVAAHGPVHFQCSCGELSATREAFTAHQKDTGHEGQTVIHTDREPLPTTTNTQTEPVDLETADDAADSLPNIDASAVEDIPESGEKNEEAIEFVDVVSNGSVPNGEEIASTDAVEEEVPKGKLKLKCHLCDKMFSNKQSKSMHIKAVHAGERPYVCGVCGAAFPYPRSLTLHAIRHRRAHATKGYACDLCGKVLNHPSSVVYHKEAEHTNHQYVCLKCGKGFKHKQLLQRHQLVHSQLRPHTCTLCPATFKTKTNLMNHQLLHSGERRFSCGLCPQRFAHKTSLTLHMRLHSGIKPYTCTECGKSFSQKGNLSEHARTHSGEKPYACQICGRTFTTSSQRRLHIRRHAMAKPASSTVSTSAVPPAAPPPAHPPAPAPRAHRCGACARAFSTRAALLRHARRHHAAGAAKHKRTEKQQLSLLAPPPASPPQEEEEEEEVPAEGGEEEERIIYVTYEEGNDFQIVNDEPPAALEGAAELTPCELYSEPLLGAPQELYSVEEVPDTEHLAAVTDEDGNPLHLTMADGTKLAITSHDGCSLQLLTADGHTIPVQINDYQDEESPVIEELDLKTMEMEEDPPVAHYFVV